MCPGAHAALTWCVRQQRCVRRERAAGAVPPPVQAPPPTHPSHSPRVQAPRTPTRTPQKKKKVTWSPDVIEKSRPPRVGLVCTLKDASKRLDSFIRYHQRVGFAQIYLYFDDASETADIEAARGYADVEVIVRDEALVAAWANLPGWAALKDYVQDDVLSSMSSPAGVSSPSPDRCAIDPGLLP